MENLFVLFLFLYLIFNICFCNIYFYYMLKYTVRRLFLFIKQNLQLFPYLSCRISTIFFRPRNPPHTGPRPFDALSRICFSLSHTVYLSRF